MAQTEVIWVLQCNTCRTIITDSSCLMRVDDDHSLVVVSGTLFHFPQAVVVNFVIGCSNINIEEVTPKQAAVVVPGFDRAHILECSGCNDSVGVQPLVDDSAPIFCLCGDKTTVYRFGSPSAGMAAPRAPIPAPMSDTERLRSLELEWQKVRPQHESKTPEVTPHSE